MGKPQIKPVRNNKAKGKTYTALINKYNEAMNNGYFGEAELIVYAFIEDRLRSFLYYFGALKPNNKQYISEEMSAIYGNKINVNNMSTKINMINTLFKACGNKANQNDFINDARKIIKYALKPGEVKKTLRKIEKWSSYRNEIVHAMFNKDIDELRIGYEEHVKEGYILA